MGTPHLWRVSSQTSRRQSRPYDGAVCSGIDRLVLSQQFKLRHDQMVHTLVPSEGSSMRRMAILLCVLVGLSGCGQPTPNIKPHMLADDFPGPWQEPSPAVVVTLGHAGAQGCGEMYQRQGPSGEFLVYCTGNGGTTWAGWRVWPLINQTSGPDRVFPYENTAKIPLPEAKSRVFFEDQPRPHRKKRHDG